MRTTRLSAMAAMAALSAGGVRRGFRPAAGPPWARRAVRLLRPAREKYPGQRSAFLVGAWRPMTADQVRELNAAITPRAPRVRGGAS